MTYGMTSLPAGTKHPLTMKGAIAPWTFNAATGLDLGAHLFDSLSERFSLSE
jgi:hypothetical protein